jgi:hypothetical protein
VIDIALKFDGLPGDLRTTIENEARPGGRQLRRHPNLYMKLARALAGRASIAARFPVRPMMNRDYFWETFEPSS